MSKNTGKICVVLSCYKLHDNVLRNFLFMNETPFTDNGVFTCVVSDVNRPHLESSSVRIIRYPFPQSVFNFSKTLNFGIRTSLDFDIIIKTDIDICFSDSTIKMCLESVDESRGLVCLSAHVRSFEEAKKNEPIWPGRLPIQTTGLGACFALHKTRWETVYGYNENLNGWGFEDADMLRRAHARSHKVPRSKKTPLFHLRHSDRKGRFFPHHLQSNQKNSFSVRYINQNWGIPENENS